MRKIVVFNLVSIDGFFAGLDGNIDWHNVDDEFNKFAIEQTSSFGTIIFGRVTYKIFEEYWPTALKDPKTSDDDRKIAQIIDDIEKIVFSRTLDSVAWNNSKLMKEVDAKEVASWKQHFDKLSEKKDMVIYGSGQIVQAFAKLGLIDEYRLLVNPVVLGAGKPLFAEKQNLKLLNTRTFGNGNVLLCYQPVQQ